MLRTVAIEVAGMVSVTAIVHLHLENMRYRNLAASTIQQRRYTLSRLGRFLYEEGRHPVEATTEDILAFRDRRTLSGQPLQQASIAGELAHLGSFYRWLQVEGYRPDDPMARVPRPRLPKWLPHPIPEADFARAVDLAPERIRPWLFLAAFAGLRACEIGPLRGEDLWWHTDPQLIVVRRGKGGDPGTVPMSPVLAIELDGMARRGWLFPRCDGQAGPTPAHQVSHLANNFLHRIGITHTLHSLRHRFGTQVYRASGRDIRQTQELMRHRSIVSTSVYTMVDQSEAAGTVGALPAPLRAIA